MDHSALGELHYWKKIVLLGADLFYLNKNILTTNQTMPDWLSDKHTTIHNTINLVVTFFANEDDRIRLGFQNLGGSPTPIEQNPSPQQLTLLGQWYYNEFLPKAEAMNTAYNAWEEYSQRTPAHTLRLLDTEKAVKHELRNLHRILKALPWVTNTDLQIMGFPIRHASTHTPSPVPDSYPAADQISSPTPGTVIIHYHDSISHKTAKPKGAHGALMRYAALDQEPTSREELSSTIFSTTSPITLHFDLSMRGKKIFLTMCWENMTGRHGDYGPIVSLIIG
ncbi:MAG: hypothetical protein LBD28_00875 [Tannerellaceae bacterium]|jgi:hypothetical protein|nr:hypothetical protein [Tannerellaceae bacterium]